MQTTEGIVDYPDVFFTPEYAKVFEPTGFGGKLNWFNYAGIDYLFYERPIEGTLYKDITSPYGYSGPVALNGDADWPAFLAKFHNYCVEENIIAEFARLHPFIGNHIFFGFPFLNDEYWKAKAFDMGVIESGKVVYLDLTQPFKFDKGCKSSINKAKKNGIEIRTGNDDFYQFAFLSLYNMTMRRNHASDKYFFNMDFVNHLLKLPGAILFTAWYNTRIIAAMILLVHGDYAHYFLAGSDSNYLHLCPNNLLLSEGIDYAKIQGCKIFNFGGGLEPNDSLLSFKRSFSRTIKPFYTYRKIHNMKAYLSLCGTADITGFFPYYRR